MIVEFSPVKTAEETEALAKMAGEIWREYWPALIGSEQTEYMIEKFQSLEAITRDIAEHNYEYWFVRVAEDAEDASEVADGAHGASEPQFRTVGFTGGHDEPETNRFFISKIYLLAEERGRGFASKIIAFYEELCRTRGFDAMYLTVNKHNELGTRAYFGKGFETIESVETDIGCGYIMDDYIMEKKVSRA